MQQRQRPVDQRVTQPGQPAQLLRRQRLDMAAPRRLDNPAINTPGSETRASLSTGGTRLYFGCRRSPDDPGDVFAGTRLKLRE